MSAAPAATGVQGVHVLPSYHLHHAFRFASTTASASCWPSGSIAMLVRTIRPGWFMNAYLSLYAAAAAAC